MGNPQCMDMMVPRSSWEGGTREVDLQMKSIAESPGSCRGNGSVNFFLFDYAFGMWLPKKLKQRRNARFREWYLSGMCAVCQHRNIENAVNYVFNDGMWGPCEPPRLVS